MSSAQFISQTIMQYPENQLIFASKLYEELLCEEVSESAYYKTLERLCKAGNLCKIGKGTYYRPKVSKYGVIPPSQSEIISAFTGFEQGTVVGYHLYNNLKLTTQVAKTIEVLSSAIEQKTKSISNVILRYCDLTYTEDVKNMIHMMEVLQNFYEIQDLNYSQFIRVCEHFSCVYRDDVFEKVYKEMRYQKKTISFLRNVLDYYHVPNQLNRYLSSLSIYKHPKMEDIYEAAQLSQ